MDTKSDRKLDITKKILDVEDDSVLSKIEEILAETETVAYTTNGESLNRDQYKKRIEDISKEVQSGGKNFTSDEVQDYVKNRKI
ncbi:hypothetical protein [Rhodohalobacter sulfatireducens]|uniref:Addiction module protein n=1 Tax=Rhodohalobacter sulfatireducens TaxID=2911366 RepID=A0ABS9KJV5_9BACT|nr:hypothetical protein [Rhodohalobacter sulfatireducens]MCG2591124.1 hypothetical protein [Rhodohalobacter sulfatireducens]